MVRYYQLERTAWNEALTGLLPLYRVYAPVYRKNTLDYKIIAKEEVPEIVYNTPKPVTPLKAFFLPIKENVVLTPAKDLPVVVMGVPGCDLYALDLLDKFFLDEDFPDLYYAERRSGTILIGTDCHSVNAHCHCTSYGLNPYPEKNQDIILNMLNGHVFVSVYTDKGEEFLSKILEAVPFRSLDGDEPNDVQQIRQKVKKELEGMNRRLPNYQESADAMLNAEEEIWRKYAKTCVSCGACALICPTCTCFLLIDRPGFEKVRQLDVCQYPGFERTAGGEDPLKKMENRFRNRYLCKYLYRPEKFEAIACTGCGRCIEACIGKIDKNELLVELT